VINSNQIMFKAMSHVGLHFLVVGLKDRAKVIGLSAERSEDFFGEVVCFLGGTGVFSVVCVPLRNLLGEPHDDLNLLDSQLSGIEVFLGKIDSCVNKNVVGFEESVLLGLPDLPLSHSVGQANEGETSDLVFLLLGNIRSTFHRFSLV